MVPPDGEKKHRAPLWTPLGKADTLPASRELDALVAEKVMGLRPSKQWRKSGEKVNPDGSKEPFGNEYWFLLDAEGKTQWVHGWMFHEMEEIEVPVYSTSISEAWEVVEHLELGPIGLSSRRGDSWRLVKTFQGNIRLDVMTPGGIVAGPEAETVPLAICRAALKIGERP